MIRFLKFVLVILYIIKGNELVLINIIFMKYKIEENDIIYMIFFWYVFVFLNFSEILEEGELLIFLRFYYYINILKENFF